MKARTQHNPLSCLLNDDIEGLYVLYPDCGPYALSANVSDPRLSQLDLAWRAS